MPSEFKELHPRQGPRLFSFGFFPALCLLVALSVLSCASRPSPAVPEELPAIPEKPPVEEAETGPVEEPETGPPAAGAAWSAGLLLAFDDKFTEAWESYFDLFDRYAARVTFFITGGYDPFCADAEERGHEIGYHTRRHLNLLKVSPEVFFEETGGGAEALRRQGLRLKSFAYPYGYSEPWMDETLGEHFSVLRGFGVTTRIYNVDTIRAKIVVSKSIDNIRYKSDAEFEKDIADMLGAIASGGGILPLTTHTIAADADWGISPARLEYLLKTAVELGLRFYRYGDFFED
ncbi:MAG: polysaccharide deacetylase family protein [Treponema sp.]|nr:polysaccharide deacetylase family protein [Treponema sp.]